MGQQCLTPCCSPSVELSQENIGKGHEDMMKAFGAMPHNATLLAVIAGLAKIEEEDPYLRPTGTEIKPHPLLFRMRHCRQLIIQHKTSEAQECLERITSALDFEKKQVADAFRRFDTDNSQVLDASEFGYMCAYIGLGEEEAKLMDKDQDSLITLPEFQAFVGNMGGLQNLFDQRRKRVARKQWGIEAPAILKVGDRVRAYYSTQDGNKSTVWKEAQILQIGVPPTSGVMIGFGFDDETKDWPRQVVAQSWIFSDTKDADVVAALREVGILVEQQAFWASIFPQSEMRAVERLVPCQRAALAVVRGSASTLHDAALPRVRERFQSLGYSETELQAVLGWVQDLAPMLVHLHICDVGRFLEVDEFYRSQFETGTSRGALDDRNAIRKGWETELFAGAYDDCKPFDRCKYGALGVLNDYKGEQRAYQYGDSYLVLKDVRLRTTFAATDSGGIKGSRLAVLDKYAHVLAEYSDTEVKELVEVAMANTSLANAQKERPQLLRGMTGDPTAEWITLGYPDVAQKKGRFYFEVQLLEGGASPQVGVLSSKFTVSPKTKGLNGGVGDDEFGWACDGQHAMLWNMGKKLPWNRSWASENQKLLEHVVVGVAVDLDKRQIWFSSNGDWDENPSFGQDSIPKDVSLYPAISLQGRAAFNFGPTFKHSPLNRDNPEFKSWPNMPPGDIRVDNQIIGNSANITIYKEIQIHGELNLKRNVQRLVANSKYKDMGKNKRTWAIRVDGLGVANGTYYRSGARHSMPIYTHKNKQCLLSYHLESKTWRLTSTDNEADWLAEAPAVTGSFDAPRTGWELPLGKRGCVSADIFKAGIEKTGISSSIRDQLLQKLSSTDSAGQQVVFRVPSFNEAWGKLDAPPMDSDGAWSKVVDEAQLRLLKEHGMIGAQVVETPEHPYPAKSHNFSKTVIVPGASKIQVSFASKCRTYDSAALLQVYAGGLSKSSAGIGARVSVKGISGDEEIHGTIAGKTGLWRVNIDNDEAEICGDFRSWLDEEKTRLCICYCDDAPKVFTVRYAGGKKVGDEIAGFLLDKSCPLTPITVKGFCGVGVAQKAGVNVGWYLDVVALLKEPQFRKLTVEGKKPKTLSDVAENLEGLMEQLESLRNLTNISLTFASGLDYYILPICTVKYSEGTTVDSEISEFVSSAGVVLVSSFSDHGPAHAAGVRVGWRLCLRQTFNEGSNMKALEGLTREELIENPQSILKLSDITLIFEPVDTSPKLFYQAHGKHGKVYQEGRDLGDEDEDEDVDEVESEEEEEGEGTSAPTEEPNWPQCVIPSDKAFFEWTTDGDGTAAPEARWGFFAVVTGDGEEGPNQKSIDAFANAWFLETSKARGMNTGQISVEPEDWDEARLRALCARHGWEFEWMSEEGEMARRIEGAERAKKVGLEASAEISSPTKASGGAWWRMNTATRAAMNQSGGRDPNGAQR